MNRSTLKSKQLCPRFGCATLFGPSGKCCGLEVLLDGEAISWHCPSPKCAMVRAVWAEFLFPAYIQLPHGLKMGLDDEAFPPEVSKYLLTCAI